jgi:hypothetical protein
MHMRLTVALLSTLALLANPAWPQASSKDILKCSDAKDDAAKLKCYEALAARVRDSTAAKAHEAGGTAVTGSTAAANTPAAMASPRSGKWPTDPNFGLQGDALRKAQERASPDRNADHKAPTLVARVARVSRRPGFPLAVTLDNGQVWEELQQGSDVLISPNDPVTIKAGIMDSFFLTDVTRRTIRVRRIS